MTDLAADTIGVVVGEWGGLPPTGNKSGGGGAAYTALPKVFAYPKIHNFCLLQFSSKLHLGNRVIIFSLYKEIFIYLQ